MKSKYSKDNNLEEKIIDENVFIDEDIESENIESENIETEDIEPKLNDTENEGNFYMEMTIVKEEPEELQDVNNSDVNNSESSNEDDEYYINEFGERKFKTDEHGCRKGYKWDDDSGHCVPV